MILDCDGVLVHSERLSHGVFAQMLGALRTPYCVAAIGNRSKVEFTLGHTGLLPRLAGRIFSADDVQHPKPALDLVLHAARSLGSASRRTVVAEDTPTGIAAAAADALSDSMAELQALLAAG